MVHKPSEPELAFKYLWKALYPEINLFAEKAIIPGRKLRHDFVNFEGRVAIEIQGGIYRRNSAHNSPKGLIRDFEKANLAAIYGWATFFLAPEQITEWWITLIARCIQKRISAFKVNPYRSW